MSKKIYTSGNYIVIQDTVTNKVIEGGKSTFEFIRNNSSDVAFTILRDKQSIGTIAVAEMVDFSGTPYTLNSFITFKETNTGFNPATPGSVDVVASDLQTHESNQTLFHGITMNAGVISPDNLPSFTSSIEEFANFAAFPPVGSSGVIYIAQDTSLQYRWSGTSYIALNDLSSYETHTQLDSRDVANRSRTNHTGTQTTATISDLPSVLTTHDNVNRDRTNHTGTQLAETISDLEGILDTRDNDNRDRANHTGTQTVSTLSDFNSTLSTHDSDNRARVNHTGTQPASTISDLTSILDSRDTSNRARANHTGTQLSSTISDLSTVLDGRDTSNRARANHTGTQTASTISDLTSILDSRDTANRSRSNHTGTQTTSTISDLSSVLDARDTANRARANHTGTQTASTISDFTNAARAATVVDAINSGVTVTAPSQGAVFTEFERKLYASTGVISGAGASINAGDNTKFDFQISGVIVDSTTNARTIVNVNLVAQTLTNLLTQPETYLTVNTAGSIVQSSTPPLPGDRANMLCSWVVVHTNHTQILFVNNFPEYNNGVEVQLHQLIDFIGFSNYNGNVFGQGTVGGRLSKSGGRVMKNGVGSSLSEKNSVDMAAITDATFAMRMSTGVQGSNTQTINTTQYEIIGPGLTSIPNNKFVVHRIDLFAPTNVVRVQYGQKIYDSMAEAELGITTDTYITEGNISRNGLLRCYLIFREGVNWSNPAHFKFVEANKFGTSVAGGGVSPTLQNTYDISTAPQVVTSVSKGAFQIKRGTAADTDVVFETLNGAGTSTHSVKGNGAMTALSFIKTGGLATEALLADGSTIVPISNVNTAAASLTLSVTAILSNYVFTGTTSIWTLPVPAGNVTKKLSLMNTGTGTVTVNTNAGALVIYNGGTPLIGTYPLLAGSNVELYSDGSRWLVV